MNKNLLLKKIKTEYRFLKNGEKIEQTQFTFNGIVPEGHSDKVCDRISDAVLDALFPVSLKQEWLENICNHQ